MELVQLQADPDVHAVRRYRRTRSAFGGEARPPACRDDGARSRCVSLSPEASVRGVGAASACNLDRGRQRGVNVY